MTEEQTTTLIKKYPILYRGHTKPITESLMAFGFECGEGWYDIIDRLSAKIEAINNEIKAELEENPERAEELCFIEAAQVKEKFGGLRFYLGAILVKYDEQVHKWIEEAEQEADKTCERCGKPGKSRGGGWIMTLCDDCKREDDESKEKALKEYEEKRKKEGPKG